METKQVNGYKKKILSLLLKKYERSLTFQMGIPGKQRPQLTIAKSELAMDYEDEMDYQKKDWIHDALKELSEEGIVEVTWPKLKENIQVHKIYLNFEGIGRAYELLGVTPKEDKLRQMIGILAPLATHPWDWIRVWQQEIRSKLEARKSAGLDLEDPQGYQDLVKVLNALPDLEESTPKRIFSQNLFHDSKHFEKRIEGRLVSLLRKIYPEELDKDEDYLDQVGIVNNPRQTLLSGPLVIRPDLDLSFFPGGIGLSAECVKDLVIQDIPAKTILLIENLTTFHEVLRVPEVLPPPVLVIYTGGFPHKSTQKLLQKIARFLADQHYGRGDHEGRISEDFAGIYHWGDIDYGGIRIFEYVKRNFFPALKPYRMDTATYLEYLNGGLPFGEEQARKLQALLTDPSYSDWYQVIEQLVKYRKRVEQESMGVR